MNFLITGGCGFIGSHLAEHFIKQGHKICIIDNLSAGSLANIANINNHPNLQFIKSDLARYDDLPELVAWSDCILHMAAMLGMYNVISHPVAVINNNISTTKHLYEAVIASKKNPRIFVASSSMVYGKEIQKPSAESDTLMIQNIHDPSSSYTVSKLANESLAISYAKNNNIASTILRLFNIVGPRQSGQYGMVVPRFIDQALTGGDITVYGTGEQTRCFCDIRDFVMQVDALIMRESGVGEIINMGNNVEISINTLANIVKDQLKSSSVVRHIPYTEVYDVGFSDFMHRNPNLDKLYNLTNYTNRFKIEDTIKYIVSST